MYSKPGALMCNSDFQSRSAFPKFLTSWREKNAKQLNHKGFEVIQMMVFCDSCPLPGHGQGPDLVIGIHGGACTGICGFVQI